MQSTIINVQDSSVKEAVNAYMTKVFGWMAAALFITAITSYVVASTPTLINLILSNRILFYGLLIGEVLLVMGIAGAINRLSIGAVTALFVLYSIVNGLTLSVIFLVFTEGSIVTTFFITALTFGVMAVMGMVTKHDLTSWGKIFMMALIGLVIASVVNMFMHSDTLSWICSYAGVLIFTGLTAYDAQKIKNMGTYAIEQGENTSKLAISGALNLYLDFINLFLFLLNLFGRRK